VNILENARAIYDEIRDGMINASLRSRYPYKVLFNGEEKLKIKIKNKGLSNKEIESLKEMFKEEFVKYILQKLIDSSKFEGQEKLLIDPIGAYYSNELGKFNNHAPLENEQPFALGKNKKAIKALFEKFPQVNEIVYNASYEGEDHIYFHRNDYVNKEEAKKKKSS